MTCSYASIFCNEDDKFILISHHDRTDKYWPIHLKIILGASSPFSLTLYLSSIDHLNSFRKLLDDECDRILVDIEQDRP